MVLNVHRSRKMTKLVKKVLTPALLVVAAVILYLACLSEEKLSGLILKFSYDGEIERMGLFVIILRVALISIGTAVAACAIPFVQNFLVTRIFPVPAQKHTDRAGLIEGSITGVAITPVVLTLLNLPVVLALTLKPDYLVPMLREDGIYEVMQALLFLSSAGAMVYVVSVSVKRVRPFGLCHMVWMFLALMLFLVFLEEISYGQRILGFETPEGLGSVSQQNEFNLHNVATGFTNRIFSFVAIVCGVFFPLIAAVSTRLAYLFRRLRLSLPAWPVVLSFAFAAMYTTPPRYNVASIDEQELLSHAVLAMLLTLIAISLVRPGFRIRGWAFVTAITMMACLRLLIVLFHVNWPGGNFAEEAKELLIALGFFLYAVQLTREVRVNCLRSDSPERKGTAEMTG